MGIIEINCTYLNLGLLLLFLCNLGSIHGYFIRFCCSLFVRCCFPTQRCSQISPASTNRAPIHHESAKSLMPGRPLITSPRHGCCDVFFVGNVFQSFWFWAISDVRSGTSMTTCCVVNANIVYSYFQRGCRKKCTQNPERYYGWLSRTAPPPPPTRFPPPHARGICGEFSVIWREKGPQVSGTLTAFAHHQRTAGEWTGVFSEVDWVEHRTVHVFFKLILWNGVFYQILIYIFKLYLLTFNALLLAVRILHFSEILIVDKDTTNVLHHLKSILCGDVCYLTTTV